jgi:hypothetical protein
MGMSTFVTPAKAAVESWIPACAGMTMRVAPAQAGVQSWISACAGMTGWK